MNIVPDSILDGWMAEIKAGDFKPVCRVTVQKMSVKLINYDLAVMQSTTLQGSGKFASMMFGQKSKPVELSNLRGCTWNRSLGQFTADGQVVLSNTAGLSVGVLSDEGEFDRPGYYSFARGSATEAQERWGHTKNPANGLIVPDRLIHIYQGYGTEGFDIAPEDDSMLVKTFTGLIDEVILNTDKSLTIKFRDLGRALTDTICWPDVVPWSQYPLGFEKRHETNGEPVDNRTTSGKWIRPKYVTDSNKPYIGRGFTDGGRAYVQSDGGINGHLGRHAFDSSKSSYWLSVGNYPRWSSAFEYVQGTFKTSKVSAVKISAYGGPYTAYVSLMNSDGDWVGHSKIPYASRAVDTNADILFVKLQKIDKGGTVTIRLPKVYSDIKQVRVTFTDLWDSNIGEFQYRAGIRDVQVFSSTTTVTTTTPRIIVGNVTDYSGCISWLLAWGGFFWPKASSGFAFQTQSDGDTVNYVSIPQDMVDGDGNKVLPHGQIWGDIMMSGTYPLVPLTKDNFDKVPIADAIEMIRGILGFNFFIDETGGAVWRLPNIYVKGNYVSGALGGPNAGRTEDVYTIDENETLQGLAATVSSKNIRERVFVANVTGKYGAMASGFNPYPSGLRRFGGFTDQNFESSEECKVMADLITLSQFMSYRTSTISIPANPGIQIDDQIKIMERVTSDTYYHYVQGISSDWNAETGVWKYNLTVSWLGTEPGEHWIVNQAKLDQLTKTYLKNLGV